MFPNGSGFKRAIQLSQAVCLSRLYSQTKSLSLWNYWNIWQAYLLSFTNQAHVEFKGVFFLTCSFFFHCWNWQLNKYVLSMRLCCRILEILCRTGNYICYYRNMSCSGYREIKFLRKSFSFFILKVFSGMRTEITHSSSFAIKCNLEVVRGCPAVVASK